MKKKTLMQSVLPLIAIAITALCISFSATFARANAEPEFFIDGTAYAQTLSKNSLLEISEENKAVLGGKEYSLYYKEKVFEKKRLDVQIVGFVFSYHMRIVTINNCL